MAKRKNTFLIKRSNVPGKIPLHGDLQLGELALNTADVKLYTSGTTENDIIQIGWDRIHRTGDTVTGDFNFYGDIQISGSSEPNGYALSVTGDTDLNGNISITGNLDIIGNVVVVGDLIYDSDLIVTGGTVVQEGFTANTITISDTPTLNNNLIQILGRNEISGAVEYRSVNTIGIHRTGDTVTGDFNFYGDIQISGSSQPSGYALSVTGDTNFLGDVYVTGNTNTDNLFATSKITGNTISMPNFIYIESKDDFPESVSNVITLEDNKTYFINTTVDLLGDRLVAGQNTTILGGSSENCRLKSTGLVGTALLSSNYSIPMRGLTFEADVALNLDAGGNSNQAIDWFGVNFTNCPTVGIIKDYSNVIMSDCAFLNSSNCTFDGTIGSVGFGTCLFNGDAGSIFILPATLTITRRFRIIYSSIITLSGETSLEVNASAVIPNDGFILDTVNFAGGGTFLSGIDYTSAKALLINNVGIINSSNLGNLFMINNTTNTTIGVPNTNVYVKAAGTTTIGDNNSPRWTHTANRLTYAGNVNGNFVITSAASVRSSSPNQVVSIGIAKNDTIVDDSEVTIRMATSNQEYPGASQTVLQMTAGDYIEFFVRNTSSSNVRVADLNMIINKIPA